MGGVQVLAGADEQVPGGGGGLAPVALCGQGVGDGVGVAAPGQVQGADQELRVGVLVVGLLGVHESALRGGVVGPARSRERREGRGPAGRWFWFWFWCWRPWGSPAAGRGGSGGDGDRHPRLRCWGVAEQAVRCGGTAAQGRRGPYPVRAGRARGMGTGGGRNRMGGEPGCGGGVAPVLDGNVDRAQGLVEAAVRV